MMNFDFGQFWHQYGYLYITIIIIIIAQYYYTNRKIKQKIKVFRNLEEELRDDLVKTFKKIELPKKSKVFLSNGVNLGKLSGLLETNDYYFAMVQKGFFNPNFFFILVNTKNWKYDGEKVIITSQLFPVSLKLPLLCDNTKLGMNLDQKLKEVKINDYILEILDKMVDVLAEFNPNIQYIVKQYEGEAQTILAKKQKPLDQL